MSNNAQTYDSFINGNPFNRKLYDFLLDHRDRVLPSGDCDIRFIMHEAYRIGAGVMSMSMPEQHIQAITKQVKAQHTETANVILSIVWAVLTTQMKQNEDLRPVVQMLYEELSGDKSFRYWNRFVSSIHQSGQQLRHLFPNDSLVVVSDATSATESLDAARQLRPAQRESQDGTVHQTLVFPNVEQFNNNPARVVNIIQKK